MGNNCYIGSSLAEMENHFIDVSCIVVIDMSV